jgi:hypothetical protein
MLRVSKQRKGFSRVFCRFLAEKNPEISADHWESHRSKWGNGPACHAKKEGTSSHDRWFIPLFKGFIYYRWFIRKSSIPEHTRKKCDALSPDFMAWDHWDGNEEMFESTKTWFLVMERI